MVIMNDPDYPTTRWQYYLVYLAIVCTATLFDLFGMKVMPFIDTLGIFWSAAGCLISIVVLLAMTDHKSSGVST